MEPDISPRYRWAALTLIVIAALWRLIYLAANSPLDLAPDEAYYWNWSRQLDCAITAKARSSPG
ncbi:MAG: hypothetical protein HY269_05385 [Deltaproteobacteria bacterium]|nr:hypothetical protein [Deltaproteobacteria bacterium]